MTSALLSSKDLLKQARSFHTKKELGQHFLIDADALDAICEALCLRKDDTVLEIGPGIGFLTRLLCSRAGNVVAVELDKESVRSLKDLKLPNLTVKHGDFLAYEISTGRFRQTNSKGWEEFENKKQDKIKIAGNVPYQITGLILGHLLGEIGEASEHLDLIDSIVLTVQKEVGERMVASPGSKQFGQLSLLIDYFCRAEIVRQLPASSFYPIPKVDSLVIKLTPRQEPTLVCSSHKLLRRVIKAGFAQRRKMLRKALTSLGINQDILDRLFKELQFDPQLRAESLSLEQFAQIADAIFPFAAKTRQKSDLGA